LSRRRVSRYEIIFNACAENYPTGDARNKRGYRVVFIQLRRLRNIYGRYCAYAALRVRCVSRTNKHGNKRIGYRDGLHKSHRAEIIWKAYVAID
jgi:hypothetical protein